MNNLFMAPSYKTISGKTAADLICSAKIVETKSGDFLIRSGELDLAVNDDYDMAVSGSGTTICNMDITTGEWRKLAALESNVENKYFEKLPAPNA